MNAIVMESAGNFGLKSIPVPKPGYKEVLVEIKAVSICGSDPKVFNGGYQSIGWPPAFPFIPGHEFSGVIAALG